MSGKKQFFFRERAILLPIQCHKYLPIHVRTAFDIALNFLIAVTLRTILQNAMQLQKHCRDMELQNLNKAILHTICSAAIFCYVEIFQQFFYAM